MKQVKVSSRYAKALFDLALENKVLDDIKNDMELISSVSSESKDFNYILDSPIINENKKLAIFKAVFENKIHNLTFSFFKIIVKKNRESCLNEISSHFIELYKDYKGIKTAILTTTSKIDDTIKQNI